MKNRFQNLKTKLSGRVAIAAALGVVGLAAAGTALAADKGSGEDRGDVVKPAMPMPGGPPPGGFAIGFAGPGDDAVSDDFAQELSDHLDGVSADEISTALNEIADEHEAERRSEMADELAGQLDGVDAAAIAAALQVAEDKMKAAFDDGKMPDPGLFTQTLADELGISEDDVTKALEAIQQQAFEDHGFGGKDGDGPAGAPGMPGFGPPPAVGGGFTMPAPPPAPGSGSGSGSSSSPGSNN